MKSAVLSFAMLLVISSSLFGQLQMTPENGWTGVELLTQGDDITAISDAGYGNTVSRGRFDGLGIYQINANSLSVWINHESADAAISRVELDRSKLIQAVQSTFDNGATQYPTGITTSMGYAYDSIYDSTFNFNSNSNPVASGTSAVESYGNANFDRFCSGTSYLPNSFGAGSGFVDNMYITGEEVSGGRFYALDEANNDLWEVDAFGDGNWENAALMDTGNSTHVAMVLNSDVGSGNGDYMRMYVGEKNVDANGDGGIDFLERNGLRGGTTYYFEPEAGASTTNLPNGLVMGGWSTSTANALQETKLEDVHTNPLDGTQAVFADQTDGVYILEQDLSFSGGSLDLLNSTFSIQQIDDADTGPIGAPDNLTWSADGMIYIQEDGNGNDMFQMNADGSGLVQIASSFSEPSGIMDISSYLGYSPGSVFLSSMQGSGGANAQLALLIGPNLSAVPELNSFVLFSIAGIGISTFRRRRVDQ